MQNNFLKNIFYLFLPLVSGSIICLIMSNFIDYGSLVKPLLAPPGFLFPIIWSIIYLLLGISYYLYKSQNKNNKLLTIFWTILLLTLVIYLLYLFFREYKPSFYLNIPYLLWLIFATYLTIGVYILN